MFINPPPLVMGQGPAMARAQMMGHSGRAETTAQVLATPFSALFLTQTKE